MFLGIDTSCYTTSLALIDVEGKLIAEKRKLLDVKPESCGLRQSEMVFQHTRNLPALFEELFSEIETDLKAIAVSEKPRPLEESYMPAFVTGTSFARAIAATHGIDLFLTNHQQNHIEAGLWSAGGPKAGCFITLHISGGTTDLLLVEKAGSSFLINEIGSSIDISAGQFVDRVGVALELPFPCGKHLEILAKESTAPVQVPVAVKGLNASFSGPLTATKKLIEAKVSKEDIAAGVQVALAKSFAKLLANACKQAKCQDVLFVGGVSANLFIRNFLVNKLKNEQIYMHFPQPQFCSDNAVGCAVYAWHRWRQACG